MGEFAFQISIIIINILQKYLVLLQNIENILETGKNVHFKVPGLFYTALAVQQFGIAGAV